MADEHFHRCPLRRRNWRASPLDVPCSGFIRFAGGPLHNQHVCLPHWLVRINVPRPVNCAMLPEPGPIQRPEPPIEYALQCLRSEGVATYFEYHAAKELPH